LGEWADIRVRRPRRSRPVRLRPAPRFGLNSTGATDR
jgi:hypothetical protein